MMAEVTVSELDKVAPVKKQTRGYTKTDTTKQPCLSTSSHSLSLSVHGSSMDQLLSTHIFLPKGYVDLSQTVNNNSTLNIILIFSFSEN